MRSITLFGLAASVILLGGCSAAADPEQDAALIESALTAAPSSITDHATIKTMDGRVLREGTSDWTCYPGSEMAGPMCNQAQWDSVMMAWSQKTDPEVSQLSVSYMLAGDGDAAGVSNIDPFATEPTADNQWVKEGPHLMILVPDASTLDGLSTDPNDPVYVMWGNTPYAHIMVKTTGAQ